MRDQMFLLSEEVQQTAGAVGMTRRRLHGNGGENAPLRVPQLSSVPVAYGVK
ncbi:hypothetical protein GCM10010384_43970 [Streptomyces djakartensis]|uniref:Uncharacterized protein n=1 Tax=Streptomyces djakartensis TaxID=68193 RepID=A0ABQ3A0N8_9ACTN|nr:hypothetical protein GCM10010384_43970 [Streptomyces djakartensis]